MKIVIDMALEANLRILIQEVAAGNDVLFLKDKKELISAGKGVEVYYGFCHEEIFPHLTDLMWIQSHGAGMEKQLFPALRESHVVITNAAGLYGSQVADQAFALLLALTRKLHYSIRFQDKRQWQFDRLYKSMIEIGGMTIGIVGMGGIGQHMARRAKGFEMAVIGVDPYLRKKPEHCDELVGMDRLPEIMKRVDVVMIACPLTEETRGLINAEMLSLMKPTAYLINVARGPIHDEPALIEVLKQHKIAGAGLDVTAVEPLSRDSPLWDMVNVIISPHVGGFSQNRPRRTVELFCENLKRYLVGESLKNVVNKELGF